MNIKSLFFSIFATVVIFASSCGSKPNYNVRLKTDIDSGSYYLGYFYGSNFHNWDFEDVNVDALARGIAEAIKHGKNVDEEIIERGQEFLGEFQVTLQNRVSEKNLKAGQDFLEANKKKQGVFSLPSGLQYKIITEGTGARPNRDDMVEVHYHGTLIDETVFDSSKDRGQPAMFNVGQVVPGFSEALMMMSEGAVWEVYIPSDLGYGEFGRPPHIKPNSVLIFEINMLKVIPNEPEDEE